MLRASLETETARFRCHSEKAADCGGKCRSKRQKKLARYSNFFFSTFNFDCPGRRVFQLLLFSAEHPNFLLGTIFVALCWFFASMNRFLPTRCSPLRYRKSGVAFPVLAIFIFESRAQNSIYSKLVTFYCRRYASPNFVQWTTRVIIVFREFRLSAPCIFHTACL